MDRTPSLVASSNLQFLQLSVTDDTEIVTMAVYPDGTLIASASERGHIIKIYSTDGGEVV